MSTFHENLVQSFSNFKGKYVNQLTDNFAETEASPVATKAYEAGQYLTCTNAFLKAKTNISIGDNLVVGTNVEETSVGNELENLSSDAVDINFDDTTAQTGSNNVQGAIEALKSSFSSALTSLKNTAIAQAVGATGSTFASVIATLGNIVNRGAVSQSITATTSTQTYTVPAGYHNGSGVVTVSPQQHSGTYSVTSNGTKDMGASHNYRYVSVSVFNFTCDSVVTNSHKLGNNGTSTVNVLSGKTLTVGNSYIVFLEGTYYTNLVNISSNPGLTLTQLANWRNDYTGDVGSFNNRILKITVTSSSYSLNITYGSSFRGTDTTKILWCYLLR